MEEITGTTQTQPRPVRILTEHGSLQGCLNVSAFLRTLDDLNVVSGGFLTVHPPIEAPPGWVIRRGPLLVNTVSVLFLMELSKYRPDRRNRIEVARLQRAFTCLQVGDYSIQGFLHVPPGGDPMRRIKQANHAFLALTSVSVVGPDLEIDTPFLAVNRSHILSAQGNLDSGSPSQFAVELAEDTEPVGVGALPGEEENED